MNWSTIAAVALFYLSVSFGKFVYDQISAKPPKNRTVQIIEEIVIEEEEEEQLQQSITTTTTLTTKTKNESTADKASIDEKPKNLDIPKKVQSNHHEQQHKDKLVSLNNLKKGDAKSTINNQSRFSNDLPKHKIQNKKIDTPSASSVNQKKTDLKIKNVHFEKKIDLSQIGSNEDVEEGNLVGKISTKKSLKLNSVAKKTPRPKARAKGKKSISKSTLFTKLLSTKDNETSVDLPSKNMFDQLEKDTLKERFEIKLSDEEKPVQKKKSTTGGASRPPGMRGGVTAVSLGAILSAKNKLKSTRN